MNINLAGPGSLTRTHPPEPNVVFFAMPYGTKALNGHDGETCDFDKVYPILEKMLRDNGYKPERLDGLYGPTAMIDLIWRSIQRAEYVVVDFTTRNHNVTFEFGLALVLGKKIVMITQDGDHVPSDYRGHRVLTYSLMYDQMEQLKTDLLRQVKALGELPSQEQELTRMWALNSGYQVCAPATVIQVEREYVVVRTDDPTRPPAVLSNADVDRTRLIADMARKFKVGDRVDGAFVGDPRKGTAKYTLIGGQEDPWPTLVAQFPVGKVLTGTVRTVLDKVGAFVEVYGDVNGLIPEASIVGPVPPVGTPVEVRIARMDAINRKVSLRLNSRMTLVPPAAARDVGADVGDRCDGQVVRAVPPQDGKSGFILLKLDGRDRPAILPYKEMSEDLRSDLDNGHVDRGEAIYVEVISVDPVRDRVVLRELPPPEESSDSNELEVMAA